MTARGTAKMDSTRPSLLIRVRDKNNSDAWVEFFELYSPMLYSFARERGLGHEDADDIRASCYETIVTRIGEFNYSKENTGFRAWLRTMVTRRVIDLVRKKKVPIAQDRDIQSLVDNHETMDEAWEKNWRLHHLRYCVAQVGKRVQPQSFEAFRLLTEQGVDVKTVCKMLGMSPQQVYKIKSRFLELVREEMKSFDMD